MAENKLGKIEEKDQKDEKKTKEKKNYICSFLGNLLICEEYLNDKKTGEVKIYSNKKGFSMGIDGPKEGLLIYEGGFLNEKKMEKEKNIMKLMNY